MTQLRSFAKLLPDNQRQIALSTQMYADDPNDAFPKADPIDHTRWIKL